jgi:DNA-binding protein YbaB
MLQDLVVAAVNAGIRAAQQMMAEEMGKVTGGLGIKLPGMP